MTIDEKVAKVRDAVEDARPTLDEIREQPATVSVKYASAAVGISTSYGYELADTDAFPCQVLTVGKRRRVVTASLIALLAGAGELTQAS